MIPMISSQVFNLQTCHHLQQAAKMHKITMENMGEKIPAWLPVTEH